MKRLTLIIGLLVLTLAGCKHDKPGNTHEGTVFATRTLSGEQCYQVTFDKEKEPWGIDFVTKTDNRGCLCFDFTFYFLSVAREQYQ